MMIFLLIGVGVFFLSSRDLPVDVSLNYDASITESEDSNIKDTQLINAIDFQSIVDQWINSTSGNRSVVIYDLDRDELSASYNVNEPYITASLYKLFVVYEGYRRVENNEWDGKSIVGSTGRTVLDCLDLSIRESDSPCAETLWKMIGHAELDAVIKQDFNILNSNISALTSNVRDVMKIMKLFYTHSEIKNDSLIQQMKDSFLNQPTTTYNWRQGLPSGFKKANVYNKVGWDYNPTGGYWNAYHDAAIVEFPEQNRHFIIVIMTNFVSYQKISELGELIEEAFLNSYF